MEDDAEYMDYVCCRGGGGMSERRVSGWFVLSAVFIVAVFGLFFTFTERKTWPEQRTELAANDMRLVPPSSTLWCEAIALYSDHPFVAYQVSQPPHINPTRLNKQKVNLNLKLNGGRNGNFIQLKYYLLPSSVVEISACAQHSGARLFIFQGEDSATSYLQEAYEEYNESVSSNSDSIENDSSEDISDILPAKRVTRVNFEHITQQSSLISNKEIDANDDDNAIFNCEPYLFQRPLQVNVTNADFYVIAVLNTSPKTNSVGLRISLDRARYTVLKTGLTYDMCSLSPACTIGLTFASRDRALVWIPEEPNAGRSTFVIRSQCKPRLAVFAILSVFFPLVIFLGVAFVVRADRERIMRIYQCGGRTNREQQRSDPRVVAPLLDDAVTDGTDFTPFHIVEVPRTTATESEELPPAYHTLYDPPPPYACVKDQNAK